MFWFAKKRRFIEAQIRAFPAEYREDVIAICKKLSFRQLHDDRLLCAHDYFIQYGRGFDWLLSNGDRIKIPCRIYMDDRADSVLCELNEVQKIIYHCMFSRSCDGYTREKHIRMLLSKDLPEWAKIYVIKICDEYVVEILQAVYESLCKKDCTKYKEISARNIENIKVGHNRMISYWQRFYRYDCYWYKDYIGKKLFAECFGYKKTGQKRIT